MDSALQIVLNGLLLGALYACIAVGFSLVWGVLNIINMLHGSFIVLGGYLTYFAWQVYGIHPFLSLLVVAPILFAVGWALQYGLINRVVAQPVLTTLILTFGLDMILYNVMTLAFTATPRRITLDFGSLSAFGAVVPVDRLAAMALALTLTAALFALLRASSLGRAIVAVRMDRDAAALMGVKVDQIYAVTFGIGALMAGACGTLLAIVYPVTTSMTDLFLGKAFVVCVLGGLGSVPGALVGGLALGLIEATAGHLIGPQHAVTAGFALMLLVLVTRPAGLMGKLGYE
jgi:branched-chain amino acid transport system permease protein